MKEKLQFRSAKFPGLWKLLKKRIITGDIGGGEGIHWEDIDEYILGKGLL